MLDEGEESLSDGIHHISSDTNRVRWKSPCSICERLWKRLPMLDTRVESLSDGIHRIHWTQTDSDGKVHVYLIQMWKTSKKFNHVGLGGRKSFRWNPSVESNRFWWKVHDIFIRVLRLSFWDSMVVFVKSYIIGLRSWSLRHPIVLSDTHELWSNSFKTCTLIDHMRAARKLITNIAHTNAGGDLLPIEQTLEHKSSPSKHSPIAPVAPIKTALNPRGSSELCWLCWGVASPPSAIFIAYLVLAPTSFPGILPGKQRSKTRIRKRESGNGNPKMKIWNLESGIWNLEPECQKRKSETWIRNPESRYYEWR